MSPEEAIDKFAEAVTRIALINEPWVCSVSNESGTIQAHCYEEHQVYKPILIGILIAIGLNGLFTCIKHTCCRK